MKIWMMSGLLGLVLWGVSFTPIHADELTAAYAQARAQGEKALQEKQPLTLKLTDPSGTRYDILVIRSRGQEVALAIFSYTPAGKLMEQGRYPIEEFAAFLDSYRNLGFLVSEIKITEKALHGR